MSDTRDPKTTGHGDGDAPDAEALDLEARHDAGALAALDAEIRSLRDEPVSADSLMRMRAGLRAGIEAEAAARIPRPTPIAARMRGRFGAGLLAAAVAAAAAVFLLLVPALETWRSGPPPPQPVVDLDRAPAPSDVDASSDEALAIAFELELLRDYEVIAQLDLLELLDDPAAAPGSGRADGEGRI